MTYALSITMDRPFDETVEATRAALTTSGFGVVSDIDMHATFGAKLGESAAAELGEYRILGACNPRLAQRALASEPDVGLLLPCNVVVRQDEMGALRVEFMDPNAVLELVNKPEISQIASEVRAKLERVMAALP